MPCYILKIILKERPISEIEMWILNEWRRNATEQEFDYYTRMYDKLFFN